MKQSRNVHAYAQLSVHQSFENRNGTPLQSVRWAVVEDGLPKAYFSSHI